MSETQTAPQPHTSYLPQGVRAQVERAHALMREMGATGVPEDPAAAQDPPAAETQPATQDPPVAQDPPVTVVTDPPNPDEDKDEDDWAHKYRSLEGRYRAETARLQGRLESLESLLANIQAAPPREEKPVKREDSFTASPDTALTDEERRDYGDDMIGLIRKVATQVAYEVAGKVRDELTQVRERVDTTTSTIEKSEKDKFFDGLRAAVPDWQTLNADKDFLTWLSETDPLAGVQRQELLNAAVSGRDVRRAAAFFQTFKREQAAETPQAGQPPAPAGGAAPAAPAQPRPTLESLAAPGRGKSGGSATPQDKPVITQAYIRKFYEDKRRGAFKGREAEAARIERDIFAAQADGRFRNA